MKRILCGFILFLSLLISTGIAFGTPLVNINWIKENSCKPGIVVLDIRNELSGDSKDDYLKGHIPCAIYSDYMKDGWRTKVNNIPGMLPPVPQIEKLIGSLGIDNNTYVVIYSAGTSALDMGSATRVYWTFKVLGHNKVSVLNGGFAAYKADKNNPIETAMNAPNPRIFVANFQKDMYLTKVDVHKAMKEGLELVDNRPNDQYLGVNRIAIVKRNGTIPTAKNIPESWFTENNGGNFRDIAKLKKLYKYVGVSIKGRQINFCNTGHRASLGWFVASELLGNKDVQLYDGSMAEWSMDPEMPMEQKIDP
ncbi:MAG: sulfurtransferase [Nitrospiraceae bacterium]|nr:sulfurtransferase [Nitrospiraceae bacterium]